MPFATPSATIIYWEQYLHTCIWSGTKWNVYLPSRDRSNGAMLNHSSAAAATDSKYTSMWHDENTAGWQRAKEATLSSPSGLHFGHYMVEGTFNPTIAVFNAQLANLRFTTRFSLKWWQTGINVLLEKQLGNFTCKKLSIFFYSKGTSTTTTNG